MFQPEIEDPEEFQVNYSTSRILDMFMDSSSAYNEYEPPSVPPRVRAPTPKPTEEPLPVYRIVPFVAKTEVPLNIPRKHLEDYMDR